MIQGIVAIVGRPNVGKSTLFNALVKDVRAIVDDTPGVTRDRLYGTVRMSSEHRGFTLVDTGGFEEGDGEYQPFKENLVWQQTTAAVEEADVVILLLDGREGLQKDDQDIHRWLKTQNKTVLVVVNKLDDQNMDHLVWDFLSLGEEQCLALSARRKRNVRALKDRIWHALSQQVGLAARADASEKTSIALIGRPNVGKSSILNRLLGDTRALVSDIAGTTRDSIHSDLVYKQQHYHIVDTAGIRRKTRINEKLEGLSVMRSLRAIDQADVVLLVIDAEHGITDQDLRLANLTLDRQKALMLVVNKWDLVPNKESKTMEQYSRNLRELALRSLDFVPIHFMSCLKNQRVHSLMASVESLASDYSRRVETSKVNAVLQDLIQRHTPQLIRKYKKRVRFYFATQVETQPPTFVVKCNVASEIHESYKRFLMNQFRQRLGLSQVPIRMLYRGKQDKKKEAALTKKLIQEGVSEKINLKAYQETARRPAR